MSIWGKIFFVLIGFLPIYFWPICVFASDTGSLYFSEVGWRGSSVSTSDEFLELKNSTPDIIDLAGYKIFDEVSGQAMVEIENGQIASGGNFLIANSEKDYKYSKGESVLNVDPDLVDSSISLSNDHFGISLRDKDDKIIDVAGNTKKPFFGEFNGFISSMERAEPVTDGTYQSSWASCQSRQNLDDKITDYATPQNSGKIILKNFTITDNKFKRNSLAKIDFNIDYDTGVNKSAKIYIEIIENGKTSYKDEFYSRMGSINYYIGSICPTIKVELVSDLGLVTTSQIDLICYQLSDFSRFTEVEPTPQADYNLDGKIDSNDEWVELGNFSLDQKVYLDGWKIVDLSGKQFNLSGVVLPEGGYLVFGKLQSKISLNDNGEQLSLIDPLGKIIDEVKIPSHSSKNVSTYARWGDNWFFTISVTPGKENIIIQDEATDNLSDVTKNKNNEGVKSTFSGEIINYDRDNILIKDSNSDLQINLKPSSEIGSLSQGDLVSGEGVVRGDSPYRIDLLSQTITSKIQLSQLSDEGANNNSTSQDREVIVTTTVLRKRRQIDNFGRVEGVSISKSASQGLKSNPSLLYFLGIFNLLSLAGVYGIYSRK